MQLKVKLNVKLKYKLNVNKKKKSDICLNPSAVIQDLYSFTC